MLYVNTAGLAEHLSSLLFFHGEFKHKHKFLSAVKKNMMDDVAILHSPRQIFERIQLSVKSLILHYTPDYKITNSYLFQPVS